MRDDKKTITFEFEFAYSYLGSIVKGNSITVVEPSFQDRAVYRTMKAWMTEAFKGISKMSKEEAAAKVEEVAPDAAPPVAGEEPDPYLIMSMGLEGSRFAEFGGYVEKALTNNKRLAFCGDDAANGVPVTDIIWQAIAREGGMEAVDKVCSEFTSFFMARKSSPPPSEKKTGTSSPATVRPDPLAPSPTRKR